MQIVLRGAAAGDEAEDTARIFYPAAELSQTLPDDTADLVLAVAHRYLLLVLVRQNGTTTWVQQRPPQGDARTQEYALCRMLYTMLCGVTGIRPPWGMMTGVRPVRIIHDLRAEGKTEEEIEQRFLQHFDCTPRRFAMAKSIADLQRPVLERAQPMDCSVYAGIPFCPSRCSYCSFVSRTVGDKSSRALVAPYVDCLCKELAATRAAADAAHLSIKTLYIGGGAPPPRPPPPPMMPMRLPVEGAESGGVVLSAWSHAKRLMPQMLTASSTMLRRQCASHGCSQT